ncbi:MAG: pyruvate formate lyase family protein [Armatimonadota bacterium]
MEAIEHEISCVPSAKRRGSTDRVNQLAAAAVTRPYRRYSEYLSLYEAVVSIEGEHRYRRAARSFAEVYPKMTPVIRPGELLVGAKLRDEDTPSDWMWIPDSYENEVPTYAKRVPADYPKIRAMADRALISPVAPQCHKAVDYANYIRVGSRALAERARAIAETRTSDEREFALAFADSHEALIAMAHRYAEVAAALAGLDPDPKRAAELWEIARICAKVPAEPAGTFHEALQSFWFAYMVSGDSTGRIDVFLREFYEADIASGRLTPARALELIECLMIKLHDDYSDNQMNVSSVHTMTLGGQLSDGSDASSDLTRLFLTAIRNVRLLRPSVYLRCFDGTPDDLLTSAVEMLAEGLSEPSFYGDTPIVSGLVRVGIPTEEARDYVLGGCTEVVSPGRGNWGAPTGWINVAMLVDDALRDAAREGARHTDGLWHAIDDHIEEIADTVQTVTRIMDENADLDWHTTMLMPCCLERCTDIGRGGAQSYITQWAGVGLPNAVDMLYAAHHLITTDGASLADIFRLLDSGDTALFRRLRSLPKFGNDHEEVDALGAELLDRIAGALERRRTPLRQALTFAHLSGGQNMHINYGKRMGATLDARMAGDPLSDSLAGAHGRAVCGPTALIRSICRLDHSKMNGGTISTLMLSESDAATPEGRRNVAALVKAYVALGGSQLQLNFIDAATLRQAQKNPADYRGLMVRVAGYSAEFTHIGKSLQDEIISRLEGASAE